MELYNEEFVYFDWDDKLDGKKGFVAQNIASLKSQVNDGPKTMVTLSSSDDDVCPFTYFCDGEITCDYQFAYYDPYYELRKAYLEGKQLQFRNYKGEWEDVDGTPLFTYDEYRVKPEYRIKPEWYVVLDDYGLSRTIEPSENETVLSKGTEEECIECMEKYKQFENILLARRQGKTIQYKDHDKWVDWVIYTNPNTDDFDYCKEWRIKDEVEYVPFDSVQELIDGWKKRSSLEFNRELLMPFIWIKEKNFDRSYLITEYYFKRDMNEGDIGTSNNYFTLNELFERFTFLDGSTIGKVKENEE